MNMINERFDLPQSKRWEVTLRRVPTLAARPIIGMNDRETGDTVGVRYERSSADRRILYVYSTSGLRQSGSLSVTYSAVGQEDLESSGPVIRQVA